MGENRNNRMGMNQNRNNMQNLALNNSGMQRQSTQSSSCQNMMNKLRTLDFAIIETGLYLNVYPRCQKALDYYHKLVDARKSVADAIERQCGPLTAWGNVSNTSWDWTEGPWPWEADAN